MHSSPGVEVEAKSWRLIERGKGNGLPWRVVQRLERCTSFVRFSYNLMATVWYFAIMAIASLRIAWLQWRGEMGGCGGRWRGVYDGRLGEDELIYHVTQLSWEI
jgi:hypothetical protein